TLDVVVGAEPAEQLTTDEDGSAEFMISGDFSVGDYDITATAVDVDASASVSFTVDADEDWYAGWDEPTAWAAEFVVTQSQLAEGMPVGGEGFPDESAVAMTIDDGEATIVRADILGEVATELTGPLPVGAHTVPFSHPVGPGRGPS